MKVTAKSVAALTLPADKSDVIHFDDALPRFGYRLRRSSGKVLRSWVVQYRRGRRSPRIKIGSADVITAEAARAAAKKILAKVDLGEDPQSDRHDRRSKDKLTLRALVDDYLVAKRQQLRPRSFVEIKRYLTTGYFKPLHNLPIDSITRRDVAHRVVAIARESGSPTAARARGALSAFFAWCMQMGLVEHNPTVGSAKPAESKPRDRVLSDDELAAVWHACPNNDFGRIVKLLILMPCRRAEIGDMRWSEINPDGTWTLPPERSKNGRPLALPLMPMARAIIESVPQLVTRDQLFGQRSHGFTRWVQDKCALDERLAGQVQSWHLHDLRRSVATRMADLGIMPHVIEEILNHRSGHKRGVAGTYNRSPYEREVRAALTLWEDHIRALVAGDERKILNFQ